MTYKRIPGRNSIMMKTSDPQWYDPECSIKKTQLKKLSSQLEKEPQNIDIRTKIYEEKKQYKNMLKRKKKNY